MKEGGSLIALILILLLIGCLDRSCALRGATSRQVASPKGGRP